MIESAKGKQLARSIAMTLDLVGEHGKTHPGEADALCAMFVSHVRSSRPQALQLDTSPVPKIEAP